MVTIYNKTEQECEYEKSFKKNKEVCTTYMIDEDKGKIDTCDLTEKQIIRLIKQDLLDYFSPDGSYKKNYRTRLDVLELAPLVKGKFLPKVNGAYELYKLMPTYGEIIARLLNDFGYMPIIQRVVYITKYLKESHSDFDAITFEEMITVLSQMANNESEREYNTSMRLK